MADTSPPDGGEVRTAEVIAALSLATDLALGAPFEYGLRSTLAAMQLCDRLQVDSDTAAQTYFLCLLFYVGCNAPVDVEPEVFGDDRAFVTYATPQRFGSRADAAFGMLRAVAPPDSPWKVRARQIFTHMPRLMVAMPGVVAASCEVARMLAEGLGLDRSLTRAFAYEEERYDGSGLPAGAAGDEIPLPMRIVHVARDAAFQRVLGDDDFVADRMRERAGRALDPTAAGLVADDPTGVLETGRESLWESVLEREPQPWLKLEGGAIEDAIEAMAHFADMGVPHLVGHSSGVSALAADAARHLGLEPDEIAEVRRAGLVHDLGRVAVSARVWEKPGPLTADEWEQVRLHPYHTERILFRSPYLARLAASASFHHERLDGSGYHRGITGASLGPIGRVLAAADTYHALTESRPHRGNFDPSDAADVVRDEVAAGRLESRAATAVLDAAGLSLPAVPPPSGLTEREAEVVRLLAHGRQTKQIARTLQISAKTVDFHIQNAYRKMGVSTRAGATLFAMREGLAHWENSR